MKTLSQGKTLSRVEVTHISTYGLWLLTDSSELFVSFIDFPSFRKISSIKLTHVVQLHSDMLYWPDLNIEIPVKGLRCFPLASAELHRARRSGRQTKPRAVAV